MQAGKNALKQRDLWNVPHGDTLLFCFSCASILYAYCYRPETLPADYYKFLVEKGGVSKDILKLQEKNQRNIESGYLLADTDGFINGLS
jgi:hypothetical protein